MVLKRMLLRKIASVQHVIKKMKLAYFVSTCSPWIILSLMLQMHIIPLLSVFWQRPGVVFCACCLMGIRGNPAPGNNSIFLLNFLSSGLARSDLPSLRLAAFSQPSQAPSVHVCCFHCWAGDMVSLRRLWRMEEGEWEAPTISINSHLVPIPVLAAAWLSGSQMSFGWC